MKVVAENDDASTEATKLVAGSVRELLQNINDGKTKAAVLVYYIDGVAAFDIVGGPIGYDLLGALRVASVRLELDMVPRCEECGE